MKNRMVILIICGLILVSVLGFNMLCAIETSVRHTAVRTALVDLPAHIEFYRKDKGNYPKSLEELAATYPSLQLRLHDQWKDHYEYKVGTNGFSLTVEMPSGCFVRKEEFGRVCKIDEALEWPTNN